jgi:hypothetical protein
MPQLLVDDPQALALGIGYAAYRAMVKGDYKLASPIQWTPYPESDPLFGWFATGWSDAARQDRAGSVHAAIRATQGGHVV